VLSHARLELIWRYRDLVRQHDRILETIYWLNPDLRALLLLTSTASPLSTPTATPLSALERPISLTSNH